MGVVLPLKKPASFFLRIGFGAVVLTTAPAFPALAQLSENIPQGPQFPPDTAQTVAPSPAAPVAPPAQVPLDNTFPSQDYAASINTMDALNDERKLAVGDTLSYRVVEEEKEPVQLVVKASGEVNVPLLGLFPAAGKTCKQLAEELKPLLQKDYFYAATVIIGLDTESTQSLGKVYLMGQVHSQGSIELPANEPLTVSQAVLLNGGLADFADKHHVKLLRKGPDGKTITTNVDIDAIYRGRSNKDPVLQPGDTINVTEKLINF
jgi:polysaccharide export outer membrane protein